MRVSQRARTVAADLVFAGLVLWSIGATVLVLRRNTISAAPRPFVATREVANWKQYGSEGHALGPADAAVTVVVFAEFQCPACGRMAAMLDSIRSRHSEVRIVERHFPLNDVHGFAFGAALAAECAADVGKWRELRTTMYAERTLVDAGRWGVLARDAGIADTAGVRACIVSQRHASKVRADMKAGVGLGIEATPSYLINSTLYDGALAYSDLQDAIERQLRK